MQDLKNKLGSFIERIEKSWKMTLLTGRVTGLSLILALLVSFFHKDGAASKPKFYLAEVIPSGLEFDPKYTTLPNVGNELVDLINSANTTLVFASFYFSLIDRSSDPAQYNDTAGRRVLEALREAGKRGVNMYFMTAPKSKLMPSLDLDDLQKQFPKNVFVKYVDMSQFIQYKSGIFHTKFTVVDQISFYIGSANADYRSYSEIVEIGVFGWNNPVVAGNLMKIANLYFPMVPVNISTDTQQQQQEFSEYSKSGQYDDSHKIVLNPDTQLSGYMTFSPMDIMISPFQWDAQALVSVINSAKQSLVLATMDYSVGSKFLAEHKIYWEMIDGALRRAAFERKVYVRIITNMTRTNDNMNWHHLKSLSVVSNIHVKILQLPPTLEPPAPFSRWWHAKFAVSESEAWLSTNNVGPNYFLACAGSSLHICSGGKQFPEIHWQMIGLFNKYWYSNYTKNL